MPTRHLRYFNLNCPNKHVKVKEGTMERMWYLDTTKSRAQKPLQQAHLQHAQLINSHSWCMYFTLTYKPTHKPTHKRPSSFDAKQHQIVRLPTTPEDRSAHTYRASTFCHTFRHHHKSKYLKTMVLVLFRTWTNLSQRLKYAWRGMRCSCSCRMNSSTAASTPKPI